MSNSLMPTEEELAARRGATAGQIALAWLLHKGDDIVPIPGTKRIKYLEENMTATEISLSPEEMRSLEAAISSLNVAGARYAEEGMKGLNA